MRETKEFHKHFVALTMLMLMPQTESSTMTNGGSCGNHFSNKIQNCMRPFQQLYNSHQEDQEQGDKPDDLLTKHLCFEYEKTLLCLHVALSSCATVKNTQRVQRKLSSEWVMHVNQLCHIQSRSDDDETDQSEEKDYLDNRTDESEAGETNVKKSDTRKFDKKLFTGEKFVHKTGEKMWRRVIKVRKYKHSMVVSDTQNDTTKYKIYSIMRDYSSPGTQHSLCSLLVIVAMFFQHFLSNIS